MKELNRIWMIIDHLQVFFSFFLFKYGFFLKLDDLFFQLEVA